MLRSSKYYLVQLLFLVSFAVPNAQAFVTPKKFSSKYVVPKYGASFQQGSTDTSLSKGILTSKQHRYRTPNDFALSLADSTSANEEDPVVEGSTSVLSKLNQWRKGIFQKKDDDDLTFKQKLAKMGLSVLLSYGFVSNMSYVVSVSLAWYGFCKTKQLSPLAPGQWKPFLAVYAGFYVFNNIIRPLRLALSAYVAVYFDRIIAFIQKKTKCSQRAAIFLVVFFANIVGTTSLMCLGIFLASAATGVPIFMK